MAKDHRPGHGPNQKQVVHRQTSLQTSVWNYPVPPPDMLEKYPPEIAARFAEEWRLEAEHRRANEKELLRLQDKDLSLQELDVRKAHFYDAYSLTLSFVLIGGLLGAAVFFAYIGHSLAAIGGLVTALALFWKRRPNQETVQRK